MKRRAFLLSLPAAAAWAAPADGHRMEITLERAGDSGWKTVPPGLVLDQGDRVRFRFRSNFDGYLYVMNQGTSGSYTLLFPRDETGRDNNITSGREFLIPATEAYFRIAGPPGHDIVYWMLTPVAMGGTSSPSYVPLPPPPKTPPPPQNLLPRCDASLLRARGLCIDTSAGPKQVDADEPLPENLAGLPGVRSRELVIMRRQNQTVLSSPSPMNGPVVYEFRLAHR